MSGDGRAPDVHISSCLLYFCVKRGLFSREQLCVKRGLFPRAQICFKRGLFPRTQLTHSPHFLFSLKREWFFALQPLRPASILLIRSGKESRIILACAGFFQSRIRLSHQLLLL